MSRTAQTARMLAAAERDLRAAAVPPLAAGFEREWLLGSLIGSIDAMAYFRAKDMTEDADRVFNGMLDRVRHHYAARPDELAPSFARQHSEEAH